MKDKKITEEKFKIIDTLSMSIITNQLALFYNEELIRLKCKHYKHNLKKNLNLTIKELKKAENLEFDKVEKAGEKISTIQSDNLQDALLFLSKNGLIDFMFLNKVNISARYDRKRLEGIVDKILKENLKNEV